ncbi:MAG: hypothetical protein ACRELY_07775 [Polyangiaceae bacterium]
MMRLRHVLLFVLMACAAIVACGSPNSDARIGVLAPDRTQFDPVGALVDHRCGSLDCHGQTSRNLQVFGCEGMRLDPSAVPGCRNAGGTDTTEAEYDATYRSIVGLEPAVMSDVVANKGAHPEELTFVRKARAEESHKGGPIIVPGDEQDVCITSWLAGTTDTATCAKALTDFP